MSQVVKDIVQFAIINEQKAAELYDKYGETVKSDSTKELLKFMANTERAHEARLKMLYENKDEFDIGKPIDLILDNFRVPTVLKENSSINEVFKFAIDSEQKAFELYSELANADFSEETRAFFSTLASDEQKHRFDLENEFEKEYRKEFDFEE